MLFENLAKITSEFLYLTYLTCICYNITFEISVLSLPVKAMDPHLPSNAEAVVFTLHSIPQLLYNDQYVPYLLLPIWLLSAVAYSKEILTLRNTSGKISFKRN